MWPVSHVPLKTVSCQTLKSSYKMLIASSYHKMSTRSSETSLLLSLLHGYMEKDSICLSPTVIPRRWANLFGVRLSALHSPKRESIYYYPLSFCNSSPLTDFSSRLLHWTVSLSNQKAGTRISYVNTVLEAPKGSFITDVTQVGEGGVLNCVTLSRKLSVKQTF